MESDMKFNGNPIDELAILTAVIPKGNLRSNEGGSYVELVVKEGVSFSQGLKKISKIAVADTVVSDGAIFGPHYHKEREIIIVYEGALKMWRGAGNDEDDYSLIKEREVFICEPNIPHRAQAIGETRFIAITMPSAKDFPDARKTK